jgi:hypothetical protein
MTTRSSTVLPLAGLLLGLLTAGPARAQTSYWTSSTSEEYPPASCQSGYVANDISCKGSYCDNIRLRCVARASEGLAFVSSYWSSWFSEEGGTNLETKITPLCIAGGDCGPSITMPVGRNFHVCHNGAGIVTAITCKGKYCDNLSLRCQKPDSSKHHLRACSWTPYFSEEGSGSPFVPGTNRVIVGIECKGSYCDNKRALICDLAEVGQACKYNYQCPAGSFCQYPEDSSWLRLTQYACGRDGRLGLCKLKSVLCPVDTGYDVTGCNGVRYDSKCHAHQAGVSIQDAYPE